MQAPKKSKNTAGKKLAREAAVPEEFAEVEEVSQADETPRPTVLVVEDNEWVQGYVVKIFGSDYNVEIASDGVYAMEKLETLLPDLIILDIMMPRMDGNEVFKRLKENPALARVPVIMFTAISSEENRLEGLEMGADDYIGKPFNPRELLARSKNLIQLRRQEKELQLLNQHLETRIAEQVAIITTARGAYERELIKAKEVAEEANDVKSFILKNISGEIRTPITNILGFAEILEERVSEEDKSFVNYIEVNGRRLLETISTILDFSRIMVGQIDFLRTDESLSDVVRSAIARYEPTVNEKQINIRGLIADGEDQISVDRPAVDAILNHLIGNAVKFTHEGEIVVRAAQKEGVLSIQVSDTGQGISEKFLPDVFKPFKQELGEDDRTFDGAGVGLTIAKKLSNLMGGDIRVKSEKGKGSSFAVVLASRSLKTAERAPIPSKNALPEQEEAVEVSAA